MGRPARWVLAPTWPQAPPLCGDWAPTSRVSWGRPHTGVAGGQKNGAYLQRPSYVSDPGLSSEVPEQAAVGADRSSQRPVGLHATTGSAVASEREELAGWLAGSGRLDQR